MTPTPRTTTPRRARRLLVAAAAASLIVAGCGSDDSEPAAGAAGEPATATASPAKTLKVTETDFAIEPAEARVEEAGTVRFEVVNRGQAPHSLAIEAPAGVVETATLAAGERGEVEAELETGTYTWYCPVGDHRARGMEGTLTVGAGAAEEPEEEPSNSGGRGAYGY